MKYFTNSTLPGVEIQVPDASADAHYERMGWQPGRAEQQPPTPVTIPDAAASEPAPDASSPAPGAGVGGQAVTDVSPPIDPEPAGGEPDPSAEPSVPGHAEGDHA